MKILKYLLPYITLLFFITTGVHADDSDKKKYFDKEDIQSPFTGHPLLEEQDKSKIDINQIINISSFQLALILSVDFPSIICNLNLSDPANLSKTPII